MQNIAKTDINSPGSTSQQEHRQERPLKAAKNCRQVCLSAETKQQWQAKLESERDNSIGDATDIREKTTSLCSKQTKERIRILDYDRK